MAGGIEFGVVPWCIRWNKLCLAVCGYVVTQLLLERLLAAHRTGDLRALGGSIR